jgi:hypothetical protein
VAVRAILDGRRLISTNIQKCLGSSLDKGKSEILAVGFLCSVNDASHDGSFANGLRGSGNG